MADATALPWVAPLLNASDTLRLESGELVTKVNRAPTGVEVQTLMRCTPKRVFDLLTNYRDMPTHIVGLRSVDVLSASKQSSQVRFVMKLPFPVGRVTWTNSIEARVVGDHHGLEWTLVDGDLKANDGRLVLSPYRGQPDLTHARYSVNVTSRSVLPKAAERLATRWLVPKIVARLRAVVEVAGQ